MTPDHVATDNEKPEIGWIAEIAVMLRMLPPPRAFIDGTASRAIRTTYIRFCSIAFDHAVSSKLSAAPSGGAPSLFTRMSTPPYSLLVLSTRRTHSRARGQSACIGSTLAPLSAGRRIAAA